MTQFVALSLGLRAPTAETAQAARHLLLQAASPRAFIDIIKSLVDADMLSPCMFDLSQPIANDEVSHDQPASIISTVDQTPNSDQPDHTVTAAPEETAPQPEQGNDVAPLGGAGGDQSQSARDVETERRRYAGGLNCQPPARKRPPRRLTDFQSQIYQILRKAAAEGAESPSSNKLALATGMPRRESAQNVIRSLVQLGKIRTIRVGRERVIEIVETGERTTARPNLHSIKKTSASFGMEPIAPVVPKPIIKRQPPAPPIEFAPAPKVIDRTEWPTSPVIAEPLEIVEADERAEIVRTPAPERDWTRVAAAAQSRPIASRPASRRPLRIADSNDGCRNCGVRGSIGCEHQAPYDGAAGIEEIRATRDSQPQGPRHWGLKASR